MKSVDQNKKYKDKLKKEKLKAKELLKKQKLMEKKQRIKEVKEKRKAKVVYNRNIKKRRKQNVEIAKMIAKIRDKRTCQWCWKKTNIHWSHIINEARDHRLACDPYNIKALCYNCHFWLRHKDPVLAGERFNKKFPWRYKKLHAQYIKNQKLWNIEHERIEQQNISLKREYKKISWKDWS